MVTDGRWRSTKWNPGRVEEIYVYRSLAAVLLEAWWNGLASAPWFWISADDAGEMRRGVDGDRRHNLETQGPSCFELSGAVAKDRRNGDQIQGGI